VNLRNMRKCKSKSFKWVRTIPKSWPNISQSLISCKSRCNITSNTYPTP
jgi:hypothetical protein